MSSGRTDSPHSSKLRGYLPILESQLFMSQRCLTTERFFWQEDELVRRLLSRSLNCSIQFPRPSREPAACSLPARNTPSLCSTTIAFW